MILNLKYLNKHVDYNHFKMDTLSHVLNLITPDCYMASIDIKDAYYLVPIAEEHQKYLKFKWNDQVYKFTCFPNGLSSCPRKFTKLLKPVYSTLRKLGHISSGYIDDSYLQENNYEECVANIIDTILLFYSLGFVVHTNKSVFVPTTQLTFLGFILDSKSMHIYPTPEKAHKMVDLCSKLYNNPSPTIREVSQVLEHMVSLFPGVMFGPLYFRNIEKQKTMALQESRGNFENHMTLERKSLSEIKWWIDHVPSSFNVIQRDEPTIVMTTDASSTGWGCTLGDAHTGGLWTPEEASNHINFLEMLAVLLTKSQKTI